MIADTVTPTTTGWTRVGAEAGPVAAQHREEDQDDAAGRVDDPESDPAGRDDATDEHRVAVRAQSGLQEQGDPESEHDAAQDELRGAAHGDRHPDSKPDH